MPRKKAETNEKIEEVKNVKTTSKKAGTKKTQPNVETKTEVEVKRKRGRPRKTPELVSEEKETKNKTVSKTKVKAVTQTQKKVEVPTTNKKTKKTEEVRETGKTSTANSSQKSSNNKRSTEANKDVKKNIGNKKEKVEEEIKEKETKELVKKETINDAKLEKIGQEIKKQTTISKKKKDKINNRIFENILIANVVVLYFIFVIIGYNILDVDLYTKIINIVSIALILLTIIIFEIAYKEDNDRLAIHGIETLVLSVSTLMTLQINNLYPAKYTYAVNTISMFFAIYYVAKSIVIYCRMTKKALKRTSDIHKIRRIEE